MTLLILHPSFVSAGNLLNEKAGIQIVLYSLLFSQSKTVKYRSVLKLPCLGIYFTRIALKTFSEIISKPM